MIGEKLDDENEEGNTEVAKVSEDVRKVLKEIEGILYATEGQEVDAGEA